MAKTTVFVRIELTPSAKERLDAMNDKLGMTRLAIMSRLVEWFANQEHPTQAVVMNHLPVEFAGDIARLILKRTAEPEEEEAAAAAAAAVAAGK